MLGSSLPRNTVRRASSRLSLQSRRFSPKTGSPVRLENSEPAVVGSFGLVKRFVPICKRQVTSLLLRWRGGDKAALDALMPLVYDELRRLASHYLQRERSDHTLQSTALESPSKTLPKCWAFPLPPLKRDWNTARVWRCGQRYREPLGQLLEYSRFAFRDSQAYRQRGSSARRSARISTWL